MLSQPNPLLLKHRIIVTQPNFEKAAAQTQGGGLLMLMLLMLRLFFFAFKDTKEYFVEDFWSDDGFLQQTKKYWKETEKEKQMAACPSTDVYYVYTYSIHLYKDCMYIVYSHLVTCLSNWLGGEFASAKSSRRKALLTVTSVSGQHHHRHHHHHHQHHRHHNHHHQEKPRSLWQVFKSWMMMTSEVAVIRNFHSFLFINKEENKN